MDRPTYKPIPPSPVDFEDLRGRIHTLSIQIRFTLLPHIKTLLDTVVEAVAYIQDKNLIRVEGQEDDKTW